jgi:hypothetical protein
MISISNQFASTGRNLGNKLFTYCLAKSLASVYGYALNVPNNSYVQRSGRVLLFPFKGNTGIIVSEPEYYISDKCIYDKGLDNIIVNIKNHHTILDGYFLKYEYIKPFKTYIKNLYQTLSDKQDSLNDCIILLRDSNCDHRFKLPNSYYLNILNNINFDNLYISYDHLNKHTNLIQSLQKFNPILLDLNILDLLKFITTKKILIACQGTFSFWSVFLSNADTIFWPITNIGPNNPEWSVNLTIDDDTRINFINVLI